MYIVLVVLFLVTGVVVVSTVFKKPVPVVTQQEEQAVVLPPVDASILINWAAVKGKANTFTLSAAGLDGGYGGFEYEFTYDTEGLIQGGNNGKDPIDVSGKDVFTRQIYLGTCSSGTCKPHKGVKKVSLLVLLTDITGKKSQFSKDFDL